MSAEKRVPEIRFKRFSGEWYVKELGEIGSLKNGMNFDQSAMGYGYPFVNLENVFGFNKVENTNLGLAFSTENQRKSYSLQEGDVLFVRSSVKPEGVAEAAVVPRTMENTTYSGFIIRFRPIVNMDINFNRFVYSTTKFRGQILARSTSSANSNINQDALKRIQFGLPSKLEQTAIGNYFQKLDALINQHQQKHEKLINLKKAMLEKMFPKQGETIPEIRFKEFSGEWEERKLEEVCDVRDGTHSSPKYYQTGFPLVTSKNVKNGYINYEDIQYISKTDYEEINKRSKVDVNDILMGMIGTIGNIALIRKKTDFAIKNVALIKYKNCINFLYTYYFLHSPRITIQLEDSSNGGTQQFISLSNVRSLLMSFPQKQEQIAIGNYFQKLDALINQHQQQITKLNNIKQACLSKMFV